MQNWNVNLNKNDKVYKYWKQSKDQSQKPFKCENIIKLNSNVDHNSKYLIEEITNSNGNIFIKQYRLCKSEMLQYLVEKKTKNYTILVDGKNIYENEDLNVMKPVKKFNNREYKNIGSSMHRFGYQRSFDQKYR